MMLPLHMSSCQQAARHAVLAVARHLPDSVKVWGVPRGGTTVAALVAREFIEAELVDLPEQADVIVDDVYDSGTTAQKFLAMGKPFVSLYSRKIDVPHNCFYGEYIPPEAGWLSFPWENGINERSGEDIVIRLLQYIGEDPTREGLKETPKRVLAAWKHWCGGYEIDSSSLLKTFEDGAEGCDQMVLVKDIEIYSHCEHHLAPFFGKAHIAYIPNGRVVGLSKLARVADVFARRLQVQERLTNQIANAIDSHLKPQGVGVIVEARHMCMCSRGVNKQDSVTITSALRGALLKEDAARAEFMRLCGY